MLVCVSVCVCLCVSLCCIRNIMFIALVELDPPLLLTAYTSTLFCNHIHTHAQNQKHKSTHMICPPLKKKKKKSVKPNSVSALCEIFNCNLV